MYTILSEHPFSVFTFINHANTITYKALKRTENPCVGGSGICLLHYSPVWSAPATSFEKA